MHCNYVHIVLMSNCEIHHPGHRTEVKANIGGVINITIHMYIEHAFLLRPKKKKYCVFV